MSSKNITKRLNSLLAGSYQDSQADLVPLYREHRIFTNRNIKLTRIQAMGFDMDYTLAQYRQEALEKHTMKLGLNHMVDHYGYPEGIKSIPYVPDFAIRGLVIDSEMGNVLKMDKFRYVSLAYHGLQPLDNDRKVELYNTLRINFNVPRYRSVDSLFELLETYLYAAIIEYLETQEKKDVDYLGLYNDLRSSIDLCHRDGSLKEEIKAFPERYICDDQMLVPALFKFKEMGKRMFVITNSEPEYTDFVLSYLFRNASPYFHNWRSCFDIVGTSACKPDFFSANSEKAPTILDDKDILFFTGGNLEFLEQKLGFSGDQVLYVGDHIYGDILKSKHNSTWRTCMIVPELPFQIRAEEKAKSFLKALLKNESRHKQLIMELNWRRSLMHELYQFKEAEADELDLASLRKIDERFTTLNRQLEGYHEELSTLLCESKQLRRRISRSFNRFWGRLFKSGGQLSVFAEQIRDYACIYTSAVGNFNYYSTQSYLESTVTPMPHEKNLFSVGDINFDVSMERETPVETPVTS